MTLARRVKIMCLWIARAVGVFWIARFATRKRLRILAYHGFALHDETEFRPGLFMRAETFRRRLAWLRRASMRVLPLDDALDRLDNGTLPHRAVVITIDDGFFSTWAIACKALESFGYPATVFVTTYYAVHETPIFRLAVQYMFWKTPCRRVHVDGLEGDVEAAAVTPQTPEADALMWRVIRFGESLDGESRRQDLARRLARTLDVDYDGIVGSRILSLMTFAEIGDLPRRGCDAQLHTHRHVFPLSQSLAHAEIEDNRSALRKAGMDHRRHFCYPSGIWATQQWPWLRADGIQSAVTCDPGMNVRDTPRLALRRYLDGEDVSQVEFEAELSGVLDACRRVRDVFRRQARRHAADIDANPRPNRASRLSAAKDLVGVKGVQMLRFARHDHVTQVLG